MTDYGGGDFAGFIVCLPKRLIPNYVLYRILCPKIRSKDSEAKFAPYALRKIESALLENGFDEDEVIVASPDKLNKVIGSETKILGISTVDPAGFGPVSWTLCSLTGGGPSCTVYEFEKLLNDPAVVKHRSHMKIVIGGPGAWQTSPEIARAMGISTVFLGEGDKTAPEIFKKAIKGEEIPPVIYGEHTELNEIHRIIKPSRGGLVEITRGCGRGCQFCAPTMRKWICIPKNVILDEIKINASAGLKRVVFISDDGLRYGAHGLEINSEAVLDIVKSSLAVDGVEDWGVCHASFPTIIQAQELIHNLNEIVGFDEKRPFLGPQIGLETGSPRLIKKYMIGKPKPYSAEEWPEIVLDAMQILNENYWYPVLTLILGLPGENEDDVIRTIELIDTLKGYKGWIFPLFFTSIEGTNFQREQSFSLEKMTQAHWNLVFNCAEHSLKFTLEHLDLLVQQVSNRLTRALAKRFLKWSLRKIESSLNDVRKDPLKMVETLKGVNLSETKSVLKYFI
jgi:radical SAM superfamily enzyme YgiQ (UPF0313 family)